MVERRQLDPRRHPVPHGEGVTMTDDIIWVYMTAPNAEVAKSVGTMLVEKRLAACVNMIDGMQSLYWWKDGVQSESETVLIAKTQAHLYSELEAAVIAAHPYECPCIVAVPVQSGFGPFLEWIRTETAGQTNCIPRR